MPLDDDEKTPTDGLLPLSRFAIDCAAELSAELHVPLGAAAISILKAWMLASVRAMRTAEQREYDRLLREMEDLERRFEGVVTELVRARNALVDRAGAAGMVETTRKGPTR